MHRYYVNNNPQPSGVHEVHTSTCSFYPLINSTTYLGIHSDCKEAVRAASFIHSNVDGCYYCSPACHTR